MGKSALQQNAEKPIEQKQSAQERELPEAQNNTPTQWDNTNTGAVYPTLIPGELDGPMNYHGKQCRATFKLKEGGKYLLTIKEGATVVAQGLFQKTGNEDSLKADTLHKPPRFRGIVKDAQDESKTTPYAMWFAHHEERVSDYFQIRLDTQFVAADLKDF